MFECIYPKKDNYQLGILLKYNKAFDSVFVVNFYGQFEWISVKSVIEQNQDIDIINILNTKLLQENDSTLDKIDQKSIKINILKGKVSLNQLSKMEYNKNFYRNLVFNPIDNLNIEKDDNNNPNNINKIDMNAYDVKVEREVCKNLECQVCTYKINNYDFRKCNTCKIALHVQCMVPFEKNYEFNEIWLCRVCKPCRNCHSISKLESKCFCSVCFDCYHLECLHEMVNKSLLHENMTSNVWKCENCAKCQGCDKMLFKNLKNPIANSVISKGKGYFENCSACEKRIEKNEFCPICRKLWKADEMKMIECKCKMWVHQICDRILTEENFKKLSKKANHYFCPLCRIKEKNIQIENILNNLIK